MRSVHYLVLATLFTSISALPFSAAYAGSRSDENSITSPMTGEADTELAMNSSPVGDEVLSTSRGGSSFDPSALTNINNTWLNSTNSNNTVIGGTTGNNLIGTGSFSNTQGLVNVIQNSGNNVTIQSSTIVNMTMVGK